MLIGYARVSTTDQSPVHQVDVPLPAGAADDNIYVDTASGAEASRPKLDLVMKLPRVGDVLTVTRLGRSVPHLVTLGAELREQAEVAQQLYDAGRHTGQQLADMFGVPRSTVYGHHDPARFGRPGQTRTGATAQPVGGRR